MNEDYNIILLDNRPWLSRSGVNQFQLRSEMFMSQVSRSERTVTGIFCVFNTLDTYKSRFHPGSFTDTVNSELRNSSVKFLWNHHQGHPPTAVVRSVRELNRNELPSSILLDNPDATGGVEVVREYLNSDLAVSVFEGIELGTITEMSFGFIPVKFSFTQEFPDQPLYDAIQEIHSVRLMEVSDVLWGSNRLTQAVTKSEEISMHPAQPPVARAEDFSVSLASARLAEMEVICLTRTLSS
jgi:HK97 family phage prohead protease